jgi:hypothetical protein
MPQQDRTMPSTGETLHDGLGATLQESSRSAEGTFREVLALAEDNPAIQAIVNRWRDSDLPWERALVVMLAELARQLDETQRAFEGLLRDVAQQARE